jgi:DNA uptake protein ComE-like DNA-binding protein
MNNVSASADTPHPVAAPGPSRRSKRTSSTAGVRIAPIWQKVDINSASAEELMMLDYIGQSRVQRIIEHRPYNNTDELVVKNAIDKSIYKRIKDRITVGPASSA